MLTDEMKAQGWVEHDGGPCPVPLDSEPGVMFADGSRLEPGIWRAGRWLVGYWHHNYGLPERIIAYKPEQHNG